MKIKLLISIFFLSLLIFNCKKAIQFGVPPKELQKDMSYEQGKVYFEDERLEARYVITKELVKEDVNNSLIFYFHGLNKTELEWVKKDGFGSVYYNEIRKNPNHKSFPVISISLGRTFLFLKYLPAPFDADMESFFMDKIVPYFKKKLKANGNVYLVGHSMGGFNALTLSLRNPKFFPVIAVISPYVAPISPFTEEFDRMGEKLNAPLQEISEEQKEKNLRYQIMDSACQTRWIPEFGLARELDWLKNMDDWMISKKRYFGLALPIWVCPDCSCNSCRFG